MSFALSFSIIRIYWYLIICNSHKLHRGHLLNDLLHHLCLFLGLHLLKIKKLAKLKKRYSMKYFSQPCSVPLSPSSTSTGRPTPTPWLSFWNCALVYYFFSINFFEATLECACLRRDLHSLSCFWRISHTSHTGTSRHCAPAHITNNHQHLSSSHTWLMNIKQLKFLIFSPQHLYFSSPCICVDTNGSLTGWPLHKAYKCRFHSHWSRSPASHCSPPAPPAPRWSEPRRCLDKNGKGEVRRIS